MNMNTSNVSGDRWTAGSASDQLAGSSSSSNSNVPRDVERRLVLETVPPSTAPAAESDDSVAVLHRIRYGGE